MSERSVSRFFRGKRAKSGSGPNHDLPSGQDTSSVDRDAYDGSAGNAQTMTDCIGPASQNRGQAQSVHGTPVYSSLASRYTPAEDYQSKSTANGFPSEYKNVDMGAYPLSGSSHNTEPSGTVAANAAYPYAADSKGQHLRDRYPGLFSALQALMVFVFVGILLAIPIIVTSDARSSEDGDDSKRQSRNLVFYIFVMLLTTWVMTGGFCVIATLLPYLFRFVAHYVNPAHKKYWRVFKMLRLPIVFLFAVISGYISLDIWFWENENISSFNNAAGATQAEKDQAQTEIANTIATIARILLYLVLWAGAYFLEKVLITYLTIHYQYRANHHHIMQSKSLVETLVALYDVSYYLYPTGHPSFAEEDYVIHTAQDSNNGKSTFGGATVGALHRVSTSFAQGFGVVFGSKTTSHWFSPRSSYAVVGRALQHPAASAALAKRIWVSLVSEGGDVLTVDDIKEALGPRRHDEAVRYLKVLDENENGDVRLGEMVPSIVEAGKKRQDIYNGMADITHVINTWDWILLGILAIVMLGLVLISQIPLLMDLKDIIGFAALGISFVAGRTLNEFVQGAIFTILDHPYDVGDVVELHNLAENVKVLLVVRKISLLYTVFEEPGNSKQVQYANMRSKIKRITNLSRSGRNREAITLCVDFTTTFKDIELLRGELQKFVSEPENSRDYYPDLNVRVTNLHDMSRLELKISFRHKSNWSNEGLRAARSSRMHCAIVAAVRRVPISKPGGAKGTIGDEGRPYYTVQLNDSEGGAKRTAEADKVAKKRMDYTAPEPKPAAVAADTKDDSLTAEEIAAAEQKAAEAKKKAEDKAAKDARAKEEEAAARTKLMGIKRDGISERNTGSSTGVDLFDPENSQYLFISGKEKGLRPGRRGNGPS